MTDYKLTTKQVKALRKALALADEVVCQIEDDSHHLMTLRTLVPSLVTKCDRYLSSLKERERKSKAMKNRHAKGTS